MLSIFRQIWLTCSHGLQFSLLKSHSWDRTRAKFLLLMWQVGDIDIWSQNWHCFISLCDYSTTDAGSTVAVYQWHGGKDPEGTSGTRNSEECAWIFELHLFQRNLSWWSGESDRGFYTSKICYNLHVTCLWTMQQYNLLTHTLFWFVASPYWWNQDVH